VAVQHYDVVVPLINRASKLGTKVPIPLSADASVHTIRANDLMTISANSPANRDIATGNSKVILWAGQAVAPSDTEIASFVLAAVFALNFLSTGSSASVNRAFVLRSSRKQHLERVVEIGGYNHSPEMAFEIAKATDFSQAMAVFSGTSEATAKDASMKISMSRFCSAVGKPYLADKIIDICICLESIFNASTEIGFRFSLYNTLLSKAQTKERLAIYRRLKKLYDMRSKIVHGSSEGDEEWFKDNWSAIVGIAKLSLLQKIQFLQAHNRNEWQEHLDKLALGMEGAAA
jgi:hypothetical protein